MLGVGGENCQLGLLGRWEWGEGEGKRGEPEFFEGDGDFDAVGCLGCVEVYIGGFVG